MKKQKRKYMDLAEALISAGNSKNCWNYYKISIIRRYKNILCIKKLNEFRDYMLNIAAFFELFLFAACSFTYSFQEGKLNYNVLKTITIRDFSNKSTLVYPLLSQIFRQALNNRYIDQACWFPVLDNGDIEIEGEITNYDIQSVAVKENAFASRVRLNIEVKVKYINHKASNGNIDRTFSAWRECPVDCLDKMQNILVREIVNELVDMIYTKTIVLW